MDERLALARSYHSFAVGDARGVSPLYEELAAGVAADPAVLDLLLDLPVDQRHPTLLFAAVRHVAGTPTGYAQFRRDLYDQLAEVVEIMVERRTQTNEPARCAALFPLLTMLPQPLALLEVGASAGLCLLPDKYRYTYNGVPAGDPSSPLTIECRMDGAWTPPAGNITVAWRAGLDLNPLSVYDADDVRWLETLVWPGQHGRLDRLRTAVQIARRNPPTIVSGDLTEDLAPLAAQAPAGATLVIVHSLALIYVSLADRRRFAEQVRRLPGHWISQEPPEVLPWLAAPHPTEGSALLVALDETPIAYSSPHVGYLRWLAPSLMV